MTTGPWRSAIIGEGGGRASRWSRPGGYEHGRAQDHGGNRRPGACGETIEAETAQVTLGDHDGVRILEAADDEIATALRLQWGAAVNVHPMTFHAFTAAEMDRILAKVHVG